ncbi:MAG TPA: YkgJ family cysteine cluster protein [Candidatus Thiothrix moscowensis]|uniref:YkgJ family cysteine cluster protein n=1 Tax=unclassified Thiothrix TaxID=2636184 RepID=UPI0025E9B346|nr:MULTISPECIES: YkgJ family cysteine cluster protein [unclassified Thiothrix]HRJ51359.1 YkgJ family cysteine cluster protein [Candidatus Thiothrix moscowensis]HRJ91586.1 YkgJ family cysteine cluster protein [Candidatus Thiothrix moscowensis]
MAEKLDIPAEFQSTLVPELLTDNTSIQFNCHPGVSCFNICCKAADVTLAPFDILRLKKRLGLTSSEFLDQYTVPFQVDGHGTPGVKLRTDESKACLFVREEGCSVYEDRPAACRYYGLGVLSHRAEGSSEDVQYYFRNQEAHCQGWHTDKVMTIHDYRQQQGTPEYDAINREWMQLMLKKKSAGPAIGKPDPLSFQLYFMGSFDIDRFRRFVESPQFAKVYILSDETREELKDDIALQKFAFRLLRQVLFDEQTIPTHANILEQRWEERKDIIELRHKAAVELHLQRAEAERKAALESEAEKGNDS